MSEVSRGQFNQAMATYKQLIGEMPADYQEQFPVFDEFIDAGQLVHLLNDMHQFTGEIWLTEQGFRRIMVLLGPHANTMLMAYAAQRMESKGVKHE